MGKSVAKTVGLVMIITMLARLMGLLNNQVILTHFEAGTSLDIYNYSVQFQLYVVNCVGTAIITVMIPMFAAFYGVGEKNRAFKFADNVITLSVILAAILSVVGIFLAPTIIGFTEFNTPESRDFAITALRIMFPVLIFYVLTFTLQGLLQAQGSFLVPASVSIYNSLAVIGYVFIFGKKFGITGLLVATLIGLSLQALVQIPAIYRTEYRFRLGFGLKDPDLISSFKLVPPILISSAAYQVNMLYNISVSSKFENGVTLVTLGQTLVIQIVLALAIAVTSVVFPRLTTMVAKGEMDDYKGTVINLLKTMIFLLLPMTIGLACVSREAINFIYGYGKFSSENVTIAAKIVALYSLGGIGIGIKEVTDKAFYSLKDTMKPAFVGIAMMVANIGASLVLLRFLGVYAVPAAYSVAGITGGIAGLYILRKKVGPFGLKELIGFSIKCIFATGCMVAVVIPLARFFGSPNFGYFIDGTLGKVIHNFIAVIVPVVAGVVVFFGVSILLKVKEAVDVLGKVKAKLKI